MMENRPKPFRKGDLVTVSSMYSKFNSRMWDNIKSYPIGTITNARDSYTVDITIIQPNGNVFKIGCRRSFLSPIDKSLVDLKKEMLGIK